jgi:hypothetical protein
MLLEFFISLEEHLACRTDIGTLGHVISLEAKSGRSDIRADSWLGNVLISPLGRSPVEYEKNPQQKHRDTKEKIGI